MRSQDRPSFDEWASSRQQALVRVAFLLTGDFHRAEDLVQDALISAATRWDTLKDGNPDGWVRTVMFRANVSWWRKQRRELLMAVTPDRQALQGPDPAGAAIDALRLLTAKQRAVVILRHIEGLSVDETARVLGVSQGTVKKQTSVALGRLRELIPDLSPAEEG